MSLQIQPACRDHLDWLVEHDHHVSAPWVSRCIDHGEYLVACEGRLIVGFLRYSWFWGRIPYMDLIAVAEDRRRQGAGTALFRAWEAAMAARGANVLMTSSVEDELEPQAWHRRNGFRACGRLTLGGDEPGPEVFFIKDI